VLPTVKCSCCDCSRPQDTAKATAATRYLPVHCINSLSHVCWALPLQVDPSRVRCGYKCRGYTEDAAAGHVTVHFQDQPDIK
jgi:hypothetical protein